MTYLAGHALDASPCTKCVYCIAYNVLNVYTVLDDMYKLDTEYVQCAGYVHDNTECNRIEASSTAVLHRYLINATNAVQPVRTLSGASQNNMPTFLHRL